MNVAEGSWLQKKWRTDYVETIAKIAARLLGQETAEEDIMESQDSKPCGTSASDTGRSKEDLVESFRVVQ